MLFGLRSTRTRRTAAQRPLAAMLIALGVLLGTTARAQDRRAPEAVFQHFAKNVATYLTLRGRVLTAVPQLTVTSDASMLERTVKGLAERIRAARQEARPGDIFSPDIARAFRGYISVIMRQHAISPAALLASINDDTSRVDKREIAVNGRFPWNLGSEIPPEILVALPRLPDVLEYKFVNRDLLILDVQADLIVDILPGAVQGR